MSLKLPSATKTSPSMVTAADQPNKKLVASPTVSAGLDPTERRSKIVKEILSSEVSYVAQLDKLCTLLFFV